MPDNDNIDLETYLKDYLSRQKESKQQDAKFPTVTKGSANFVSIQQQQNTNQAAAARANRRKGSKPAPDYADIGAQYTGLGRMGLVQQQAKQ